MKDKKNLKIVLDGLNSNMLKPFKIDICTDNEATVEDVVKQLTDIIGKENMGQSAEYYYRHQGDYFVLTVNNKYIERESWHDCKPPDNSILHMVPPLSDG